MTGHLVIVDQGANNVDGFCSFSCLCTALCEEKDVRLKEKKNSMIFGDILSSNLVIFIESDDIWCQPGEMVPSPGFIEWRIFGAKRVARLFESILFPCRSSP